MKITAWMKPLAALLLMALLPACAAEVVTHPEVKAEIIAKIGQQVILYAGDAKDSAKMFCIGDTLIAYRDERPAARVRIVSYTSEHLLRGAVIAGAVMKGDVVRKGSVACTVQSAAPAPGMEPGENQPPKPK